MMSRYISKNSILLCMVIIVVGLVCGDSFCSKRQHAKSQGWTISRTANNDGVVQSRRHSLDRLTKSSYNNNNHNRGGTRHDLNNGASDGMMASELDRSGITDWVTENLETNDSKITYRSATKAGENDTLPEAGLCIGKVRILPAGGADETTSPNDSYRPIRLLVGRNGWGTGVHPTTRLCLEFIGNVMVGGETLLDYGCGSGILSIAALHLGAARSIGVDVEAEALVTAERNVHGNGYAAGRFEPVHVREVLPYGLTTQAGGGVDICVANILIGQLVRPSMVVAITTNVKAGGLICFSGIRPLEVASLLAAYDNYIEEWIDPYYAALKSSDCPGSIESYGYDCGEWCRLVGRTKISSSRMEDILSMSDLAVS